MISRRNELGVLVREHREQKNLSQDDVVEKCGVQTNRSAIAHLEQGLRIPKPDVLSGICKFLDIPPAYWHPFTSDESLLRFEFEESLAELVGRPVDLHGHDLATRLTAEAHINSLFKSNPSPTQAFDKFNSILIYYGVGPVSETFFKRYFGPSAFGSPEAFLRAVETYQMDAIRLFATFAEAFERLNETDRLETVLAPLSPVDLSRYQQRSDWDVIETIDDELLPDLGYISAKAVRQESNERSWLVTQLRNLADKVGNGEPAQLGEKTRRKIDSLLRKFDSTIQHGVSSSLFGPDESALRREAERLAPRTEEELARMEQTQQKGLRNLARYLAADHLDVYVATSMRTRADYVSVSQFARQLFEHPQVRPLKLRYFNPTQSWVDDRVAKGLVEALMLKRASVTVYMAQKSDTFGKDSEASVALGQGKPVIVYVPKLRIADVDAEQLFRRGRAELVAECSAIGAMDDIDETIDDEALVARILSARLTQLDDEQLADGVRELWADFDMHAEDRRVPTERRENYRSWLDSTIDDQRIREITQLIRDDLVGILVAVAVNFEKRARVFREIHPLRYR